MISFYPNITVPEGRCGVCLDPFKKDESILAHSSTNSSNQEMMNLHPIHEKCLKVWLENKENCPSCKQKVRLDSVFNHMDAIKVGIKNAAKVGAIGVAAIAAGAITISAFAAPIDFIAKIYPSQLAVSFFPKEVCAFGCGSLTGYLFAGLATLSAARKYRFAAVTALQLAVSGGTMAASGMCLNQFAGLVTLCAAASLLQNKPSLIVIAGASAITTAAVAASSGLLGTAMAMSKVAKVAFWGGIFGSWSLSLNVMAQIQPSELELD